MKNNKGFISTSIIFAFFITFLLLLVIIITSYAQNRILMNQVKKDIKSDLVSKYNYDENAGNENDDEIIPPEDVYLFDIINVGDYVKMTPNGKSPNLYPIDTGTSVYQSVDPTQITSWIVLNKNNDDRTIEMVSEYVSPEQIAFKGIYGYASFVGRLNQLAEAYENNNYTISSRHIGYNGNPETLSVFNELTVATSYPYDTLEKTVENGIVDNSYKTDVEAVKIAAGDLYARIAGGTKLGNYWLASRIHLTRGPNAWAFGGMYVHQIQNNTPLTPPGVNYADILRADGGVSSNVENSFHIRPIVTLKSDIVNINGTGASYDPYVLP